MSSGASDAKSASSADAPAEKSMQTTLSSGSRSPPSQKKPVKVTKQSATYNRTTAKGRKKAGSDVWYYKRACAFGNFD